MQGSRVVEAPETGDGTGMRGGCAERCWELNMGSLYQHQSALSFSSERSRNNISVMVENSLIELWRPHDRRAYSGRDLKVRVAGIAGIL
jgi:hypothetical protein